MDQVGGWARVHACMHAAGHPGALSLPVAKHRAVHSQRAASGQPAKWLQPKRASGVAFVPLGGGCAALQRAVAVPLQASCRSWSWPT